MNERQPMRPISTEIKRETRILFSQGLSLRKIAQRVGISLGSVERITADMARDSANQKGGRPKKITKRVETLIIREIKAPRVTSLIKMKNFIKTRADIEVSRMTVMRILRQYGYKSYVRPLKPRLTMTHMKNRLRWVRERQHVSEDYWQSIIFTDECEFNLLGNDGPRRVYRLPGIPSLPCHIMPTVKFGGGSVMVWGATVCAKTFQVLVP
ncbi:hypothetical protein PAPHI01_2677 [Pancytospora philotis]|nr:hypothetical protein PAPHI01_2677 [Pancytospora philotis]